MHIIKSQVDERTLQHYIDQRLLWLDTWPMEFNVGKCVVLRTKARRDQRLLDKETTTAGG